MDDSLRVWNLFWGMLFRCKILLPFLDIFLELMPCLWTYWANLFNDLRYSCFKIDWDEKSWCRPFGDYQLLARLRSYDVDKVNLKSSCNHLLLRDFKNTYPFLLLLLFLTSLHIVVPGKKSSFWGSNRYDYIWLYT